MQLRLEPEMNSKPAVDKATVDWNGHLVLGVLWA